MDINIYIATHKNYWMPEDDIYVPIQVGAYGKESLGYIRDDSGNNISSKNPNYCELTGLYWIWKNAKADYIGLVHYRRHFTSKKNVFINKKDRIINRISLEKKIHDSNGCEIFLPKPRNYWIETNYSQYAHAHHAIDLDTTRDIISEKYPTYLNVYDKSMKRTIGHRFNMFIMSYDKFDEYCRWLFDILFELEKRLDISGYNAYDARVFGFVSERLLDVWVETNGYQYKTLPYVFLESQNWFVKGLNFIKRKLGINK